MEMSWEKDIYSHTSALWIRGNLKNKNILEKVFSNYIWSESFLFLLNLCTFCCKLRWRNILRISSDIFLISGSLNNREINFLRVKVIELVIQFHNHYRWPFSRFRALERMESNDNLFRCCHCCQYFGQ